MKKKVTLTFPTLVIIAFTLVALTRLGNVHAVQTVVQLKWANPMPVYDMAVSGDANHLVAANNTGLYYFDADNRDPVWWYEPPTSFFRSVAISSDGGYVVAGDNDGFLSYFNQSTQRVENQTMSTWTSYDMGGPIERGTMDISANGNCTVVGGTGLNVWYYAGCTNRNGTNNFATWTSGPVGVMDFMTVHISADGRYVAGGGTRFDSSGFTVFYENADNTTGYCSPAWMSYGQTPARIVDLALSEDGYAVAAIDSNFASLYYWANATGLEGNPNATWTNPGFFSCLDMSGDGSKVVTGGYYLTSLHFWDNCRTRNGVQAEDWVKLETVNVYDVAMNKEGNMIAAPAMGLPSNYTAYFLTQNGTILEGYPLPQFANMVSMSADGTTTAMAGPGYDSLYLFKVEEDSTPPSINEVWQQPNNTSVQPYDNVNVFANITDDQSGVQQVTLNYTTGNGTWFTRPMDLYQRDIWNGTIPAFPYNTTITYVIIAEDNANNTITTHELGYTLQYTVIPENAAILAALIIMTATLALVAIRKKRNSKP